MLHEVVEDPGRRVAGRHEVVEPEHDADGQRLGVRVEERPAADAAGAVADQRVGGALVAGEAEPVLDDGARQPDDRLDADREVVERLLVPQAGLAGEERVDPVRRHDHAGAQLVLAGADADDALATGPGAGLGEQLVDPDAGHDVGPGLLGALGEPRVELRAEHGDGVHGLGQPLRRVVERHRGVRGEERRDVPGDPALHGRLVGEPGEHLVEDAPVEHAAGQVLGPGGLAALDERDGQPLGRQLVRGDGAGRAGPHHHDVEVGLVGHGAQASSAAAARAGRRRGRRRRRGRTGRTPGRPGRS
ncbi:hypothetical protein [Cellulomonas sp. ES6]|uniref:hypothetical protein n=1 Tax=Cellulomonas sp. ES6 TaxID=3039384 RepID=UPI0024B70862|nr:hypothetical protein [Cellulomonas sp. ES6]WHP19251.1 hypothetical protein P9841_09250 [Cellulomonas sp. ES6]